jgi:hypothetical protein
MEALAKSLVQLVTSIDLTDDEEVDPDLATTWFEDVAYELQRLPAADRTALATLIHRLAEEETNESRRVALLEFPESFGLEDPDD